MSRNPTLQDTGGGETLAHRAAGNSLQPRLRASSNAKSLFVSRSGGVPYAMAHFGQARAVTRAAFAAVLCLALLAGRCCRGAVPQESNSRRRILQSGFSREAQLEWFRSAGMRRHFPPPLFKKKKSIPCSFPSPSLCPELTSRPRKHTQPTSAAPDADVQGWTEMFSVDQQTKKEIIIGAAAENPWGTLCNSIAECS